MKKIIEGTWKRFDFRRAFVEGAQWWEYHKTGATMWQSDRNLAEVEAEKRWGPARKGEEIEAETANEICEQTRTYGLCKTCEYWKQPETNPEKGNAGFMCDPLDQDTFQPMKRGFSVRLCKHPAQTFAESPVESNGFGLVDGSEYFAVLATAENFGCVLHKQVKE